MCIAKLVKTIFAVSLDAVDPWPFHSNPFKIQRLGVCLPKEQYDGYGWDLII